MKKTKIARGIWDYVFIYSFIFTLFSCTGKSVKQDNQDVVPLGRLIDSVSTMDSSEENYKSQSLTEKVPRKLKGEPEQNVMSQKDVSKQESVDVDRIYEQSEVQAAVCLLNNSQVIDFCSKYFKYPDMEPINGKGSVDLVIERDGSVSDVIVIKSIHPELDKEFTRVFKLSPKFIPGKLNGIPVRSKFRMPIISKVM